MDEERLMTLAGYGCPSRYLVYQSVMACAVIQNELNRKSCALVTSSFGALQTLATLKKSNGKIVNPSSE